MRLKQTAIGAPRYQLTRVPKLRRAERGQGRSQSASADVHAGRGDRGFAGSHHVNNLRLTQAARGVLHGRCARLVTTPGRRPTRTTA